MAEVIRVLAPLGVAYIKSAGQWKKTAKPWPAEIDEWTHYLHGADKNPVAKDSRIGLPRSMQWTAGPGFCRTHNGDSSFSAMVTSKGRVFYIIDEGPIGFLDKRLPAKWVLIARDAFNGKLLWKRRITDWGWQSRDRFKFSRNRLATPSTLPERLISIGDKIYVTPGIHAPVMELDATSGKTLRIFEKTECTTAIFFQRGMLILVRLRQLADSKVAYRDAIREKIEIIAIDVKSGKPSWRKRVDTYLPLSAAVSNDYVTYHSMSNVVCLDLETGRQRWATPDIQSRGVTFVATPKVVITAGRDNLQAFSSSDGSKLWSGKEDKKVRGACGARPDVYVIKGVAWVGKSPVGYDLLTGKVMREIDASLIHSHGHHHRCYRDKATEKFILGSKRGIEFLDIGGDNHARNDWVRGPCRYGIMPANGMLYAPPHQCVCYPASLLLGMNALTANRDSQKTNEYGEKDRLVKGPAYNSPLVKDKNGNANWPVYRHDAKRSGFTNTAITKDMEIVWNRKIADKISASVQVGGDLYIALNDQYQVACLNAKNGKTRWNFFAGARIDTPPTIHKGRAVFGSADGWVYCINTMDGKLVWKFRAAPDQRLVGVKSRLESAWPVHGSLPVIDDVVYCIAGRSSFLDGGIYMHGLDLKTGRVLYSNKLAGPHRGPSGGLGVNQGKGEAVAIDGAMNDILVYDGGCLYLQNRKFDLELVEQKVENASPHGDRVIGLHLMATSSLLDDSFFARQTWSYAERWSGRFPAIDASKTGSLIVFDSKQAYVAKPYPKDGGHGEGYKQKEGCLLLADSIDNEPRAGTSHTVSGFYAKAKIPMGRDRPAKWSAYHPVWIKAMVATREKLLVAGPPDTIPFDDPLASFEGRNGSLLTVLSKKDGKVLQKYRFDFAPIFDGMIASNGCVYITTLDGKIICLGVKK